MAFHTKVLLGMALGVLVGLLLQWATPAPAFTGLRVVQDEGGVRVAEVRQPAQRGGLRVGDVLTAAVTRAGTPEETRAVLASTADHDEWLARAAVGELVAFERRGAGAAQVQLALDPGSVRARWLVPIDLVADLFLALLKMLIVPLVLTSVASGVAGVGAGGALGRLGAKTFAYYALSSLVAVLVGQALVTAVRPGDGARLGLPLGDAGTTRLSFLDVLRRAVPENVFRAFSDNSEMLAIIFFALVIGVAITKTAPPHGERIRDLVESFFQVMLTLARGVLWFLPLGVLALLARVVATTGFGVFKPLLVFMVLVAVALLLHGAVVLPLALRFVAGVSPRRWARAMAPALVTAFSTSSSNMTLPATLEAVVERGKVSRRVAGFTVPLGSTINMDGTALYECVGVVFLAQYYASIGGAELTWTAQVLVVVLALLASVGAAGIPSAGLVMMLTILSALDLPVEGAALLLAIDRPLDMLRTVVNVWSDTCGAAVVARSEGEALPEVT